MCVGSLTQTAAGCNVKDGVPRKGPLTGQGLLKAEGGRNPAAIFVTKPTHTPTEDLSSWGTGSAAVERTGVGGGSRLTNSDK